jgi:hypothetical protein
MSAQGAHHGHDNRWVSSGFAISEKSNCPKQTGASSEIAVQISNLASGAN